MAGQEEDAIEAGWLSKGRREENNRRVFGVSIMVWAAYLWVGTVYG